MRKVIAILLLLAFANLASADVGTTWNKVRYNGGQLQTKVGPKDWDNIFTVSPQQIRFTTRDGQVFECSPKDVTGLSYGQEAHRHVAMMVSLGIVVAPIALLGLLHKQRLHFIGIEYAKPDSTKGGLLIQGADQNYREILFQLKSVTGKTIVASEKDKEFITP
jgi:hypothetical protein